MKRTFLVDKEVDERVLEIAVVGDDLFFTIGEVTEDSGTDFAVSRIGEVMVSLGEFSALLDFLADDPEPPAAPVADGGRLPGVTYNTPSFSNSYFTKVVDYPSYNMQPIGNDGDSLVGDDEG